MYFPLPISSLCLICSNLFSSLTSWTAAQMMLTNYVSPSRYTYSMLSVIGTSYAVLTWLSQTLWMPIYPLCVLAEGKGCAVFLIDISY